MRPFYCFHTAAISPAGNTSRSVRVAKDDRPLGAEVDGRTPGFHHNESRTSRQLSHSTHRFGCSVTVFCPPLRGTLTSCCPRPPTFLFFYQLVCFEYSYHMIPLLRIVGMIVNTKKSDQRHWMCVTPGGCTRRSRTG